MRIMRCLALCAVLGSACAADALTRFNEAMAGQDFQAKKSAIAALGSVKDDDAVFSALISALSDRQARDTAAQALRAKAGVRPAKGSTYPGGPDSDDAAGWGAWNAARLKAKADEARLKAAEQAAKEAKEKAAKDAAAAEEPAADTSAPEEPLPKPDSSVPGVVDSGPDLGGVDRILFKDGTLLLAYVTVKRRDLTGALTSIHIVHLAGGGEEDLDANLILRIEDDVQ